MDTSSSPPRGPPFTSPKSSVTTSNQYMAATHSASPAYRPGAALLPSPGFSSAAGKRKVSDGRDDEEACISPKSKAAKRWSNAMSLPLQRFQDRWTYCKETKQFLKNSPHVPRAKSEKQVAPYRNAYYAIDIHIENHYTISEDEWDAVIKKNNNPFQDDSAGGSMRHTRFTNIAPETQEQRCIWVNTILLITKFPRDCMYFLCVPHKIRLSSSLPHNPRDASGTLLQAVVHRLLHTIDTKEQKKLERAAEVAAAADMRRFVWYGSWAAPISLAPDYIRPESGVQTLSMGSNKGKEKEITQVQQQQEGFDQAGDPDITAATSSSHVEAETAQQQSTTSAESASSPSGEIPSTPSHSIAQSTSTAADHITSSPTTDIPVTPHKSTMPPPSPISRIRTGDVPPLTPNHPSPSVAGPSSSSPPQPAGPPNTPSGSSPSVKDIRIVEMKIFQSEGDEDKLLFKIARRNSPVTEMENLELRSLRSNRKRYQKLLEIMLNGN